MTERAPIDIDILVQAEFLYPMSGTLPIIAGGEVAVVADRIVYAGAAMPAGHWSPKRRLGGPGTAVLPGFVNCHSHSASIVFRSQTDEHAAKAALLEVAFRMERDITAADWRLLGEVGCADMLRAGITTINDIWYSPAQLAETVERCGLRAQLANKVFDVRLEELYRGDYTHYAAVGERRLRDGVDFVERWHGAAGGRITGRIGTHATDTCSSALHREAHAEARRLGVGMHTHAAQSAGEADQIRSQHGCGPVEYLRDLGVLGPDTVLAHLVFASDGDLDAVQETGARYAHCPTIYPRRGRYPRLADIVARGITTGFATDWMMNDPFEGMRNAVNAMRLRAGGPDGMSCEQALLLHTMGAATVLGLERDVGSLEAGKKADLIVLDLDRPHLQPYYGGYAALVYYARASDVVTSVIDGRVTLEDGVLTDLDEERALAGLSGRIAEWRRKLAALGSRAVFGSGSCCG